MAADAGRGAGNLGPEGEQDAVTLLPRCNGGAGALARNRRLDPKEPGVLNWRCVHEGESRAYCVQCEL